MSKSYEEFVVEVKRNILKELNIALEKALKEKDPAMVAAIAEALKQY